MIAVESDLIRPNFIIVGAARSGTTSLYYWLRAHPQVFMSPVKETNYFAQLKPKFTGPGDNEALHKPLERNADGSYKDRHAAIITSWQEYLALFSGSENYPARGEASPAYLFYPCTAKNIREVLPECKIVIVLREPVERAISNYKALRGAGREMLDFESALKKESDRLRKGWEHFWAYKGLGLYYEQVRRYFDVFPRNQLGIWLYEDLRENPREIYKQICKFLGVNTDFVPNFIQKNPSPDGYIPAIFRSFSQFIPDGIKSAIKLFVYERLSVQIKVKPETKAFLREYYQEDVHRLNELIPELDVVKRWGYEL